MKATYTMTCPKCWTQYTNEIKCDQCNEPLVIYANPTWTNTYTYSPYPQPQSLKKPFGAWAYILAVFFPIMGIVLGIVELTRDNEVDGRNLIIIGVVNIVLNTIIVYVLFTLYLQGML